VPHFTLQIEGSGPVCTAYVGVSAERAGALLTAGQPLPEPIVVRALVDTGASQTNVAESLLTQLGIVIKDVVPVSTASTVGDTLHSANQYDASLIVPGPPENPVPLILPSIPVLGFNPPGSHGFQALIGRDILNRCVLIYNGSTRLITLSY
jgi:hypothetical protein